MSLFLLVTADAAVLLCNDSKVHVEISEKELPMLVYDCDQNFWPTPLTLKYFITDTKGSSSELLLSLNKNLLRSLETQQGLPNPSVHLALRLSNYHNLAKENEHLNSLKTNLHNNIQK